MTGKHRDPKLLRSEYWRQRAQEAREAIKDITNTANKRILEEVAQSYEEMADLMEGHERLTHAPRDPPPAAAKVSPAVAFLRSAPSGTR
jgi:hypothetical protein